ncbi:MAG: NADH:ubiquinone oxidoreductase subunit J [Gammaproteobacteria bacterium RIFCSPHIGHO2_12_FULL_45_9]|nr:MAG: NADH:ubiquinone oxidoreductase subunit J [Gammaproteobacteria bacterium RIFCSPHIGHO2_12_FULL_45_9]
MILHLIFYAYALTAVASAVMVISTRNPVKSVLSLVVTFFSMAAIWMILQAEFLSLILLLVYVGAVMTLFLFVVMMVSVRQEVKQTGFVRYLPFVTLIVVLVVGLIIIGIGPERFDLVHYPAPASAAANYNNITQLGSILYTEYAYPFEIAGVVLLAAIIAAITLAHRRPVRRKVQKPGDQVAVRREDRVRLVKVPTEKK